MATVDKQGVVTMQELIASSLAQTRRIDQTPHREGYNHQGGVHAEAIGTEGEVSGDVGEDGVGHKS